MRVQWQEKKKCRKKKRLSLNQTNAHRTGGRFQIETLLESWLASNKERLSDLETGLGMVQDEVATINENIRSLELSFRQTLAEAISGLQEGGSNAPRASRRTDETQHQGSFQRENANPLGQIMAHRHVKLQFPKFNEGDPIAWISKAKQYFAYQNIPPDHRVSFASYHLEDEANEWWQATMKALAEEETVVTWEVFEEEMRARFGPTAAEDFDEALSKIRQTGSLRDYQREFERLQNKVSGWTQKALIGSYVGGLKDAISDSIRMFQPKILKATIELAQMRDEQLQRQRKFNTFNYRAQRSSTVQPPTPTGNPKRLNTKLYGQWFTTEKRFLSIMANPASQVSVIANLVAARGAVEMGWKECALCLFSLGMVHYLVIFVTLYQRLPGGNNFPTTLRPVSFLFFGAPATGSLAWNSICGTFDTVAKMLFFLSLFIFVSLVCRPTLLKKSIKRFNVAWWAYSFPITFLALDSVHYAQEVKDHVASALMLI
uniref:Retrotransposon gag domain-containing protein n=2 Tax=Brassica TaxID=3705 RepID=A0A3P6CKK8_BRAOL|nr:unnamed protein product [Brassica oleracea]